ncbi:RWD-domain-containing protein [Clavulina sp. PMI_390]|nr:RWD-domain-containing protein [Clavulina sp. PMI_390]
MSDEILAEEYEVLESIFPEELTKVGDHDLELLSVLLRVHYPPEYPDAIPDLVLTPVVGELSTEENDTLMDSMKTSGEESLGMAMVFTLVSTLQESLRTLIDQRTTSREKAAAEAVRREIEKEEARTRGTAVTPNSFAEWKKRFDVERAKLLAREDEEKMRTMSPKEREEFRRSKAKLSGRQIFEKGNVADEDEGEDEGESVDVSQYDRHAAQQEEDEVEQEGLHFSDSD